MIRFGQRAAAYSRRELQARIAGTYVYRFTRRRVMLVRQETDAVTALCSVFL